MSRRESTLINEIEAGALDDSVPLVTTLRKCIALGTQAKSAELRVWASRELNGYKPDDELPEWRVVAAPIRVDGMSGQLHIRGQAISPLSLPKSDKYRITEEVQLRQGVGELEAMVRGAEKGFVHLQPGFASLMVDYINAHNRFQHIEQIYWSVSVNSIAAVLDRMRTALAELVAELRAGMPEDVELPSGAVAAQAVQVAVSGQGHHVTVTAPQSSGGVATSTVTPPAETETPRQRKWMRVVGWLGLAATVVGAVFAGIQIWG